MKIKIVGDGTLRGTRVVNAATGELLEGVQGIKWEARYDDPPVCRLDMIQIPVELDAETGDIVRLVAETPKSDLAEMVHAAMLQRGVM